MANSGEDASNDDAIRLRLEGPQKTR